MKEAILDIPIFGWISTTIEVEDDISEAELRSMIENDEIDIPVSLDNIQNWSPILNVQDIEWAHVEAPEQLEIVFD